MKIIANYPKDKVKNKNNQWIERGSIHIRYPINNEFFDMRCIGYNLCICKGKAWINMPSKKGILNGEECEYPTGNFLRRDAQRGFVGLIQYLLGQFVKTHKYISLAEWEKKQKIILAKKNMIFVDLPSKKNI